MNIITFLGKVNGDSAKYQTWQQHQGTWYCVSDGMRRWGPGMDLTYDTVYDPNWVPDLDAGDAPYGYSLINGFCTVYVLWDDFVSNTTKVDGDLPIPDWAVSVTKSYNNYIYA